MMLAMGRAAMLSVVCVCALVLGGCGNDDEVDIKAQYTLAEEAITQQNALAYLNQYSQESIAQVEEMLRAARECSAAQTKALPPAMLMHVIELRNRCDAKRLKAMTPEDFTRWRFEEGLLTPDSDHEILVHSIKVRKDYAVMQMGVRDTGRMRVRGGRRNWVAGAINVAAAVSEGGIIPIEGMTSNFVKQDGWWKIDNVTNWNETNVWIAQNAQENQLAVADFLAAYEKEEYGKLKSNIWSPVK